MRQIQILSTRTQDLKWEPEIVVVAPFKSLPDNTWAECLSLLTEKEAPLLEEIESVIDTSKDDHVLYIVIAYVDNAICGFSLFNAWAGQTKSKAILLFYVQNLDNFKEADMLVKLTATMLIERTMQEALLLKNHDTIKDLKSIYCSSQDEWAHRIIREFDFTPVAVY